MNKVPPLFFFFQIIIIIIIISSCSTKEEQPITYEQIPLTSEFVSWSFQYKDKNYSAEVPGVIHTDLMRHRLIEDPFYRNNEQKVQWVSEKEWVYTTQFHVGDLKKFEHRRLVFEGLDTYAEVYLNGVLLESEEGKTMTNNMFRAWRFPLDTVLRDSNNVLKIKFLPSVPFEQKAAKKLPYTLPDERVFSRKAPYQSGWDWGPRLITAGIWKKVYIEQWNHFLIEDLHLQQQALNKQKAVLQVNTTVYASQNESVKVSFYLDNKKMGGLEYRLKPGQNKISKKLSVRKPEMWWPAGMGSQKLYQVRVVVEGARDVSEKTVQWGFRTVELRQKKDEVGESFEFIVNGIPTFMKGANWIPLHSFPVEGKHDARYRDLLQAAKKGNMNMIRVWGGGIYENEIFYELCDQLGLLVWQDFMFACALYPGDEEFLHNVTDEAVYQIRRLRNHPSIALWCGNNEVKNGWDDWGWKDNYTTKQQKELDYNMKNLFNKLLSDLVAEHDKRPYHPSSPEWGWGHPESFTEGDAHYWGVWWGEEPFEVWGEKTGRFMSEYGFQSYPAMESVVQFTVPEDRDLNSIVMKNHQKHGRGVQIIKKAMQQYAYIPATLEDFVYVSQLVQAYGIGEAIEKHRLKRPHCMGTLYWQLNDCWPVASWSSIDYYGNRKALHYRVEDRFKPTIVASEQVEMDHYQIYIVTDKLKDVEGELIVEEFTYGGDTLYRQVTPVTAKANKSTLALDYQQGAEVAQSEWLKLTFLDKKGKLIDQEIIIYDMTEMVPQSPHFQYEVKKTEKHYEITFTTDQLTRGVMLSTSPSVQGSYSDNYFDLLPNEPKTIIFTPSKKQQEEVRFEVKTLWN
jgi:beta-mannosidase